MKELKCIVSYGEDLSKKTNKPYQYLNLQFENGYQKRVFLDPAENYMIEQLLQNSNK